MSFTLVLNAGTASPVNLVVQSAGENAPTEVGTVTPSFNQVDRSSVRGVKRNYGSLTTYVSTAVKDSIINLLKSGRQIACSGDLLANIQTQCTVRYTGATMIPSLVDFWTVGLTLSEVQPSVTLLRYSPGDTITGESFTRSTTATYHDSIMAVRYAAINAKRDSHYQTIGGTRGKLLEDTRTNLLIRAEEFDNAAWAKSNVTVTANATPAPDGFNIADKLAATATAATVCTQNAVVAATSATYTIYIKKGSAATDANGFAIYNFTTATTLLAVTINYDTGAITYTTGSSGASLQVMTNNWYRLTLTVTAGITSGNTITVYACFTSGTYTAGTFAYVWGAQLEAAPFASSYIPTTTVAVTRGADSYSLPFTNPPTEMTVFLKFVESGTAIASGTLFSITTAGNANPRLLVVSAGGLYVVHHNTTVADVTSAQGAGPTIGDVVELAIRLYGDGSVDSVQSINSGAATTSAQSAANALATAWAGQLAWLNSQGSAGNVGFTALQQFKILAGARSLAEMRAA